MTTELLTCPVNDSDNLLNDCVLNDATDQLFASFELQSIRNRVAELKQTWSQEERDARAELGRQRRQNLVDLLFGEDHVAVE